MGEGMPQATRHFKNCLGVFQGGGCKALAFLGAFREAEQRGVFFSQLAGTSAGSIIAALVAAGATSAYLENAVTETDFRAFAREADESVRGGQFPGLHVASPFLPTKYKAAIRFLRSLGMYSSLQIEKWLEGHLRSLLKIVAPRIVTFADLNIPLHVVATEVGTAKPMIWTSSDTPNESVSHAVRCSCTIPFFFQPVDGRYVDGGIVSNLPTFVLDRAQQASFEKMLCFTFKPVETNLVLNDGRVDPEQYLLRLVATIIDSGVAIQSSFRDNLHIIEIDDVPLDTMDFDKIDQENIALTIEAGAKSARSFFNAEAIRLQRDSDVRPALFTEPQTLNQIVRESGGSKDEVFISLASTRYVYNIFPTLLSWRLTGAKIIFLTVQMAPAQLLSASAKHERFRRLVLRCLGAEIHEVSALPFEGLLFRRAEGPGNAVILDEKRTERRQANFAVKYDGREDAAAIESMIHRLTEIMTNPILSVGSDISIVKGGTDVISSRLKTLEQYKSRDVSITLEEVDVERIVFLTKYVKSYKYGQIGRLFDIYEDRGLRLFESVEIRYRVEGLDLSMPITPPVVEEHGERLYLIEGNSRLTYLIKERKVKRLSLFVIRNVSARLPTSGEFNAKQLLISDETKMGASRYENWTEADYRHIEEAVRRPSLYV
jgi:predicted acylesterase/phospholipase RssA